MCFYVHQMPFTLELKFIAVLFMMAENKNNSPTEWVHELRCVHQ